MEAARWKHAEKRKQRRDVLFSFSVCFVHESMLRGDTKHAKNKEDTNAGAFCFQRARVPFFCCCCVSLATRRHREEEAKVIERKKLRLLKHHTDVVD